MLKPGEIEKGNVLTVAEIAGYVPNSIVSMNILKKVTGTVSALSFDAGLTLTGRTSPFDTFIHVIEGSAEITLDSKAIVLEAGQGIIVPAHDKSSITAHVRCKMITTIIKSGYEEVSV